MSERSYIVGIDPGIQTGIAFYDGRTKVWVSVETTDFHAVMAWAESVPADLRISYLCVVECAKSLSVYRKKYGEKPLPIAQAQARSIGENNRESGLLIGELRRKGFEVVEYVPRSTFKNPIRKWTAEECRSITGYEERTNQHVRDAIRFAWEHRHLLRIK